MADNQRNAYFGGSGRNAIADLLTQGYGNTYAEQTGGLIRAQDPFPRGDRTDYVDPSGSPQRYIDSGFNDVADDRPGITQGNPSDLYNFRGATDMTPPGYNFNPYDTSRNGQPLSQQDFNTRYGQDTQFIPDQWSSSPPTGLTREDYAINGGWYTPPSSGDVPLPPIDVQTARPPEENPPYIPRDIDDNPRSPDDPNQIGGRQTPVASTPPPPSPFFQVPNRIDAFPGFTGTGGFVPGQTNFGFPPGNPDMSYGNPNTKADRSSYGVDERMLYEGTPGYGIQDPLGRRAAGRRS